MLEMEFLLGFRESISDDVVEVTSHSFKMVPWMSWDEWNSVRQSLFSSSPDRVAFALQRVETWRGRGCIPVTIDVTASIVEIQQRDPFYRNDSKGSLPPSDEMLAMLYCMAIMRLVNGVVEKTRKKNEVSIGEAADSIGIPRMLIDIRHEGSHRDLPSIQLLRYASAQALDWLVSYYWEPQESVILIQNEQAANLQAEIRRRLQEVALCLKAKQADKSNSSHVKGKRVRQMEALHGHNKFLSIVAGKSSHSNAAVLTKQLAKSLRNVLRLYASSSPKVVFALLEYLLIALDSSKSSEQLDDSQSADDTETKLTTFNRWKSVVLKLSSKEPEFLLVLTQAVLKRMETEEAANFGTDRSSAKSRHAELLPCLFDWLTGNLKTRQKESEQTKASKSVKSLPKATILGLLRRCLLLSYPGNKSLLPSAVTLAEMTGDNSLLHKLKKLSLLEKWNSEGDPIESCNETLLSEGERSLREAEEKFESFKLLYIQKKEGKPKQSQTGRNSRWAVVKSWNPCPVGMLPDTVGFSGRLPVFGCVDEHGKNATVLVSRNHPQICKHGKREADSEIEESNSKKMKETEADDCTIPDQTNTKAEVDAKGVKGHMMIDGVWKKVGEDELLALTSAVRLLI